MVFADPDKVMASVSNISVRILEAGNECEVKIFTCVCFCVVLHVGSPCFHPKCRSPIVTNVMMLQILNCLMRVTLNVTTCFVSLLLSCIKSLVCVVT